MWDRFRLRLIPKKLLKTLRRRDRVARCVLNIAIPETRHRAQVVAIVGELVAAGMAQHSRRAPLPPYHRRSNETEATPPPTPEPARSVARSRARNRVTRAFSLIGTSKLFSGWELNAGQIIEASRGRHDRQPPASAISALRSSFSPSSHAGSERTRPRRRHRQPVLLR
jgi:hypothetical protein